MGNISGMAGHGVQKSSTILITIQLWCVNSFGSARKENNK